MSRLAQIRQLDTSSPEALRRDLGRLVDTLDTELRALANARRGLFPEGTHPQTMSAGGSPFQLALERLHIVDMTDGNVDVTLPYARATDAGKAVGILRVQSGNTLTVYPSGSQLVNATTSQSVINAGVRIYIWCGGADGDTQRNWRIVE